MKKNYESLEQKLQSNIILTGNRLHELILNVKVHIEKYATCPKFVSYSCVPFDLKIIQ